MLTVENLSVDFITAVGKVEAVKGISFSLNQGEILALVGESGSGKTVTARSILKLPPLGARIKSGKIIFEGKDILKLSKSELLKIRGRQIAYIPQDPGNALNPIIKVGTQIEECLRPGKSSRTAEELLYLVKIPDPTAVKEKYPFMLSGGMKQRIIIAMALASECKIFIGDEPTTALDVTVQAQILDLLQDLVKKFQMSSLLITHNLALVAEYADRVLIMEKGEIVEQNDVFSLFAKPVQKYTRSLIQATPRLDGKRSYVETHHNDRDDKVSELKVESKDLEVKDLNVHFVKKNIWGKEQSRVRAVDGVSFLLRENESLGIVGESGCGKTTMARSLLRIIPLSEAEVSGEARFEHKDIFALSKKELLALRKDLQMIIQENAGALNPRKSVGDQLAEVFTIHKLCEGLEDEKAKELMDVVGVPFDRFNKFPVEFSSGERQRLVIARALAVQPKVLILDEPVASLDTIILSKILRLLAKIKDEYHLSYLFISHDISVIREMCNRIAIMYLGKIIEQAETRDLISKPVHPYTKALISAVPIPDPKKRGREKIRLAGEPPSPTNIPLGCRFHARCPTAMPICLTEEPELTELADKGHFVACHKV